MHSIKHITPIFILIFVFLSYILADDSKSIPLVVLSWNSKEAAEKAWNVINNEEKSAIDAVEAGCSLCEQMQCRKTVGFGGSPDESGETTLDAMIMDGVKMDVGAVGGLRHVKSAISVARKVLEHTEHSFLGGDLATNFAIKMGFKLESLQTAESRDMWKKWKDNQCQPNFWKNVEPNPKTTCGPYKPIDIMNTFMEPKYYEEISYSNEENHDTIGVIAIDKNGHIAAGTSTNGANHKIAGRIGDSPIPGAGAYADQQVGAAHGTGDGDIMMRFSPSFLAVEEMRRGATPTEAAQTAISRIAEHYPNFTGAITALNKDGQFGAACNGIPSFPFYVSNPEFGKPKLLTVPCIKKGYYVNVI